MLRCTVENHLCVIPAEGQVRGHERERKVAQDMQHLSPELLENRTRKKGHVGALPGMRHPILKQDHPKVGHGYRYENTNTPYGAFLNKRGQ